MALYNPTPILDFERQLGGTNSGTWGDRYNANFSRIEQAIAGLASIDVTSGSATLNVTDSGDLNADAKQRCMIYAATGTPAGAATVIVPSATAPASKLVQLMNFTSQTVAFEVSGQPNTIALKAGQRALAYLNTTGFFTATSLCDSLQVTQNLTVDGSATVGSVPATSDRSTAVPSTNWVGSVLNGAFSLSSAVNGYIEINNGFIIQWGTSTTIGDGAVTVTFPKAFSTACYAVNLNIYGPSAGRTAQVAILNANNTSATGFIGACCNSSGTAIPGFAFYWIALGV